MPRSKVLRRLAGWAIACWLGWGLLVGLAATPAAAALPGPDTFSEGFLDVPTLQSPSASVRDSWLQKAKALGASAVRFNVEWAAIAPKRRPRHFNASDPGAPGYGYHWYELDAEIQEAHLLGLNVLLNVGDAPSWAEQGHRPGWAAPGTWRPSPSALGAFAHALALRYSGTYRNRLQGNALLPQVSWFQGWDEPNLPTYLNPQWARGPGRSIIPVSPGIYRSLLNAFYAGVKGVRPQDMVLAAGTGPYGDRPGVGRMAPVLFWSQVLCLHGAGLRPAHCPNPAHFDALDHHPYSTSPVRHATARDDVSVSDIGKLARILHAAERSGRALPAGAKPIWITEIAWLTKPPNPHGISPARQARNLDLAFYTLWRQGVSNVFWFTMRDDLERVRGINPTGRGDGVFFRSGAAKPAAAAFGFPFVAVPGGHGRATVWGRAPAAGGVLIQRQLAGGWAPVGTFTTTSGGVFYGQIALPAHSTVRAVDAAGQASPPFAFG